MFKKIYITYTLYAVSFSAYAYEGSHKIYIDDSAQYLVVDTSGKLKQVSKKDPLYKTTTWSFISVPGKESAEGHLFMSGGKCLSLTTRATMQACQPSDPSQVLRLQKIDDADVFKKTQAGELLGTYQIKLAEAPTCLTGSVKKSH